MKKLVVFIIVLLLLLGLVLVVKKVTTYFALNADDPFKQIEKVVQNPIEGSPLNESSQEVEYEIENFVSDLFVPWSIVFTSNDRMLVTERSGAIRVVENGQLSKQPLITFPEVAVGGEEGLMGLELDPEYAQNKYLYASLAYGKGKDLAVKVVRLVDEGSTARVDSTIIDNLPAAQFHAGCRIKFGPDGKLYITTGDATDKNIAQDMSSLGGKILRINKDGSIPVDNPFPGSAVYSLGHRNPQGIAWHPMSNVLFQTEHGPSVFDGPAGGDEVNVIKKGENYGWPIVSHEKHKDGLIDPLLVFTPAVAPGSAMFYSGDVFPQFKNNFFFGGLKGESIVRVVLSDTEPYKVIKFEKLPGVNVGRVREVTQGPDGLIYFTSSNRDGRGKVKVGDDYIYRLVPKK